MKKILVAEDDKLISMSLCEGLSEAGFEAVPAYDGEEALVKIKEQKPDLVLLDILMPKLDGIGVLWELRSNPEISATKVIVLTNMADAETVSKILQAGATDYLLKSDNSMANIVEKINDVLSRNVDLQIS